MKAVMAELPPRYFPAPPESVFSRRYSVRRGKLCSLCSTLPMRQMGLLTWPPVAIPSRKLKAPMAPTMGSSKEVAEALAPLVDPPEARQRELARAADAHRVALQLGMAREQLRQRVVGGVERDLHGLHRRRAHRGRVRRAGEDAERRPELDVAQGTADGVELVPAQE